MRPLFLLGVAASVLAFGCEGQIGTVEGDPGFMPPGETPGEITPPPPRDRLACVGKAAPTAAPLQRLSPHGYRASVAEIFPGLSIPELTLEPDSRVNGFDNNPLGQAVTTNHIDGFANAAAAVGAAAAADLTWASCDGSGAGCAAELTNGLGERAYRRPLTTEEQSRFTTFFETVLAEESFAVAVELFVTAILQSPSFLYRPEFGTPEGALTDYELATRLSFILWDGPPDTALSEAAAAGRLSDGASLVAEVQRMLSDPRSEGAVHRFHEGWLEPEHIADVDLNPELYPDFDREFQEELIESYNASLDDAFWNGGVSDLFLSSQVYVGPETASIYGVTATGNELQPVDLDAGERSGILTHPGFLVGTMAESSLRDFHSPVMRAVRVMRSLLCLPPPAPPPDVATTIEPDATSTGPKTVRQQFEASHNQPECIGCHNTIDNIGFTFEHYDVVGRYRTEDVGMLVDASGDVVNTLDLNGPYANVVELSQAMAESDQVRDCIATNWYRFLFARAETSAEGDQCEIQDAADALRESNGDLRELVVTYLTSPSFTRLPR
ncbi:MAG: DUF1592 domain-containing protein [Myxococcota bacterium]